MYKNNLTLTKERFFFEVMNGNANVICSKALNQNEIAIANGKPTIAEFVLNRNEEKYSI